ncbi:hypothetical protein DFH09DRAFT_1099780 [Mycena vulgaris]|nr:hypothetical protein DFH09DRAFT_1099780 [Mycena vulgaris]
MPQDMGTSSSRNKQWTRHVETQYESQSLQTSPTWPLLPVEPFDTDSWNEMILSELHADAAAVHSPASPQYTVPSLPYFRHLLPCPSPTSLPFSGRGSPASSNASSPHPRGAAAPTPAPAKHARTARRRTSHSGGATQSYTARCATHAGSTSSSVIKGGLRRASRSTSATTIPIPTPALFLARLSARTAIRTVRVCGGGVRRARNSVSRVGYMRVSVAEAEAGR